MQQDLNKILDPNPDYGSGVFRRRILLTRDNGTVRSKLEDCSHAMYLDLDHNGEVITAIQATVLRAPTSVCNAAPEKLDAFIGQRLDLGDTTFNRVIDASAQCSHLYDMAVMAAAHANSVAIQRQIDIAITDENNGLLDATVMLDGRPMHHWHIRENKIVSPRALHGRSMFRGFVTWVNQTFEGEAWHCALALQRGVMVSFARRWDMTKVAGNRASDFGPGENVCYAYSENRAASGIRAHNSMRDFTHTPEKLLKFE